MRKKSILMTKGLTSLIACSMILTALPTYPVFAEEQEYIEDIDFEEPADDYDDGDEDFDENADMSFEDQDEGTEEGPAVFYVKKFKDFEKQDGKFTNEETLKKYGDLNAEEGTELDMLGLPESLTLIGYWASEGSDSVSELRLDNVKWKLDPDQYEDWETYNETSIAGEYTFVPDFDVTLMMTDCEAESIELAEDVKNLKIDVTVKEPETEEAVIPEESETETEAGDYYIPEATETEADDYYIPEATETEADDYYIPETTETEADDSYIPEATETEDDEFLIPEITEDGVYIPEATTDTVEETDEDIFANLNEDALNTETSQEPEGEGDGYELVEDGPIFITEDPQPEATEVETETVTETAIETESETITEEVWEAETTEAETSQPETEEADLIDDADAVIVEEPEPETTEVTEETETTAVFTEPAIIEEITEEITEDASIDIVEEDGDDIIDYEESVTIECFAGITDGTTGYNSPDKVRLLHDTLNYVYLDGIPCKMDLSNVDFTIDGTKVINDLDLSETSEVVFTYTDSTGTDYEISLTVHQNSHAWGDVSTCTEPATCINCGKERDVAGEHTPAGKATCTENDYCAICYQELEGTALGHRWAAATCTKPKTCKRCGATSGKKLGHIDSGDATCTENATCERCGKEMTGTALGHNWKAATCTKPKTCKRCGAQSGKALGHSMGDWVVIQTSTDTSHGIERRYCQRDNCEKYEETSLNIIGSAENNAIQGIVNGQNFDPKTRISFTAYGSGMANNNPISGDVRFIPSTWSIQETPGTFINGYEGAFSISKEGTYTVVVTYQKQIYDGSAWRSTDTADSKKVVFTVGGGSAEGQAGAIHINPQTGDDTPIIPIVCALLAALAGIIAAIVLKKRK